MLKHARAAGKVAVDNTQSKPLFGATSCLRPAAIHSELGPYSSYHLMEPVNNRMHTKNSVIRSVVCIRAPDMSEIVEKY